MYRLGARKEIIIDTVHRRKVVHVGQEGFHFDSILKARSARFQHCVEILQDLGLKDNAISYYSMFLIGGTNTVLSLTMPGSM